MINVHPINRGLFSGKTFQNCEQEFIKTQSEDDLNYIGKWKTTSFFRQMEDNLKFVGKFMSTLIFRQIEDDLNVLWQNKDNLNNLGIWKTTSIV
jgi:hypothetical protein